MRYDPLAPRGLWAITSYFNPFGFRSRRDNYRRFRQQLNVPLLTVELGFSVRFELGREDATRLVQVGGGHVMWQKERLLNRALAELPASCDKVVWVDCDVLFEREDWAALTARALSDYPLVQPFSQARELPCSGVHAVAPTRDAFSKRYVEGATDLTAHRATAEVARTEERVHDYAPGFAWAARREVLETTGFYDRMVVGGADSAMAKAAIGQHLDFADYVGFEGAQRTHYLEWAAGVHRAVGGCMGSVPGSLCALWHGDLTDRRYHSRHQILRRHAFDPSRDIALEGDGGWVWNSEKPVMHREVLAYFQSRREDGTPSRPALGAAQPS